MKQSSRAKSEYNNTATKDTTLQMHKSCPWLFYIAIILPTKSTIYYSSI